jgi:Sec-independent protein translocase protein TatA
MGNLGFQELFVLLLFGAKNLPELDSYVGAGI